MSGSSLPLLMRPDNAVADATADPGNGNGNGNDNDIVTSEPEPRGQTIDAVAVDHPVPASDYARAAWLKLAIDQHAPVATRPAKRFDGGYLSLVWGCFGWPYRKR